MISKKKALEVTQEIRNAFIVTTDKIEYAIAEEVWVPLGFASFTEWWAHYFSDLLLGNAIKAHVIYQMIAEGFSNDQIADVVPGVGPTTVNVVRRNKDSGLPPGAHAVRGHVAKDPTAPRFVTVEFTATRLKNYNRIARKFDTTVAEIAKEAIESRFKELAGG